ncbi:MAG: hypothetical protein ABUT20_63910 [Bacteroidota bacterium]
MENQFDSLAKEKTKTVLALANAYRLQDEAKINEGRKNFKAAFQKTEETRKRSIDFMQAHNPKMDKNDGNYIFLTFVMKHLPQGLIGLLIAVIFLASMGSLASGLNALASASIVDIYKRSINKNASDKRYLNASRMATLAWGIFCIIAALFAGKMGNLLEAVNVLGSLFYGTILGIFIVAFYVKNVSGHSVFISALLTELFVIYCWYFDVMAFLWLNVLGTAMVVIIGLAIEMLFPWSNKNPTA